jgi:hypothetical protein
MKLCIKRKEAKTILSFIYNLNFLSHLLENFLFHSVETFVNFEIIFADDTQNWTDLFSDTYYYDFKKML